MAIGGGSTEKILIAILGRIDEENPSIEVYLAPTLEAKGRKEMADVMRHDFLHPCISAFGLFLDGLISLVDTMAAKVTDFRWTTRLHKLDGSPCLLEWALTGRHLVTLDPSIRYTSYGHGQHVHGQRALVWRFPFVLCVLYCD